MADYINMQQDEYDEIQVKLSLMHESILVGEREIRNAIHQLVKIDGGLYVQSISIKVASLLAQMGKIMTNTNTLFEDSEKEIARHIQSVIHTDITSK